MMRIVHRPELLKGLRQLVKGLVRFCLRHSITVSEIESCIRQGFIEAAREDLRQRNQEPSVSRLSVITGLNRRQVQQLLEPEPGVASNASLIMKVIGQWQGDKQFIDVNKEPRILSCGFESSDFNRLVNSISKELNPATVLFELERVGAVQRVPAQDPKLESDHVKLVLEVYQPVEDIEAGFRIISADAHDLIVAAEENILEAPSVSNLHIRTEYDRIRPAGIVELKKWLLQEGYAFHERARDKFAEFDQDVNPDASFSGRCVRVVLGSFGKVFSEEER